MEVIYSCEVYEVIAVASGLHFLEEREHFIPVKRAAIRERMSADPRLSDLERKQLGNLFEMIADRLHFEYHGKLENLKSFYHAFDPDGDTIALPEDPTDSEAKRQQLAKGLQQLLLDANYVEMPYKQIVRCAEFPSQCKLVVKTDLTRYSLLKVFYRGIKHETRTERCRSKPWKQRSRTVHIFSRVALFVRLADETDGPVFLKVFKNVVVEDLEMLLPYVRIRMRLFDHLKIGSSVAGSMVTASWKVFTASILSPWLLFLVMSGCIAAAIRGFFGFLSSKTKYMQTLSSNLYFQNLANNTSALAYLVDSAEAEECKELYLAYTILYVERDRDHTQESLARRVDEWLKSAFGLDVSLDASEVVRKLIAQNLLVRRASPASKDAASASPDDILKVYDLPSSLRRLDAVWDAYYSYNGAQSPEHDRLADAAWPDYPPAHTPHAPRKTRIPQTL